MARNLSIAIIILCVLSAIAFIPNPLNRETQSTRSLAALGKASPIQTVSPLLEKLTDSRWQTESFFRLQQDQPELRYKLRSEWLSLEEVKSKYRRPQIIPSPPHNTFTNEKAALGKKLFFDPILSGHNNMSCASCHSPARSWTDGKPTAIGNEGKVLARRTPTLWNLAWGYRFFWDGRAQTLEDQALGPVTSPDEMNQEMDELIEEIGSIRGYVEEFSRVFPHDKPAISPKNIAKSIATFERTIISSYAPFDYWIEGDETAISDLAKEGFVLFNSKGRCVHCHSGWNFNALTVHDIGLKSEDPGDGGKFRVPTLRNISERDFFMHDGSFSSLESVIEFYNRGGDVKRPTIDEQMMPLELSLHEKEAIEEFLSTLTSTEPIVEVPKIPRNIAKK